MNNEELKPIVEGLIFAADEPMSIKDLFSVFNDNAAIEQVQIKEVLDQLREEYQGRGLELKEVGSGFRFQVREAHAEWVAKLWLERPARYSRASLETLALIAYRQPITRAEIEDVRGVSVSSNIIKALVEREWVRIVGHRDVPGKPALYSTTKTFLDYFNLKSLEDLPPLSELKDIDAINEQLILSEPPEADNVETADTEMKKPELQDVVVEETEEDEDKKMDEMDTVDDIDVSDMAGVVKIDSAIDNDEEQPSNEALTAEN
ncbi:Segregation and condensation protein B [hydrothermal vent metagenome]|uniref:Segregation and condensation protein B n=1 Tax=hydrothermal vent metagenome TaxID=652676 RepID=A0A3B1AN59_9ZZZZ